MYICITFCNILCCCSRFVHNYRRKMNTTVPQHTYIRVAAQKKTADKEAQNTPPKKWPLKSVQNSGVLKNARNAATRQKQSAEWQTLHWTCLYINFIWTLFRSFFFILRWVGIEKQIDGQPLKGYQKGGGGKWGKITSKAKNKLGPPACIHQNHLYQARLSKPLFRFL